MGKLNPKDKWSKRYRCPMGPENVVGIYTYPTRIAHLHFLMDPRMSLIIVY